MKTLALILALSLLPGCGLIMEKLDLEAADLLPTLKYCEKVDYKRRGNKAKLVLDECHVPAGM